MKREKVEQHQSSKDPEIISLRELEEKEVSHDLKELEKNRPHVADEQSAAGSMPNPEHVTAETTVERAKKWAYIKNRNGHLTSE